MHQCTHSGSAGYHLTTALVLQQYAVEHSLSTVRPAGVNSTGRETGIEVMLAANDEACVILSYAREQLPR